MTRKRDADEGTARPEGVVSLLGTQSHLDRPDERTAPAGGSDHSHFHELTPPKEDFDLERARTVCADISRQLLRDFAPVLALLPPTERQRAQALIAYARTLLDFAGDTTLEGERLAQVNRWQFALEQALGGEPPGQPIFVRLADSESERPWPRKSLDDLATITRARITLGKPDTREDLEPVSRSLAGAFFEALTAVPCPLPTRRFGEAIVRTHSLLGWRERLFQLRPDLGLAAEDGDGSSFGQAVATECSEVRQLLAEPLETGGLTTHHARGLRFLKAAALALVDEIEASLDSPTPPTLGAVTRLRLLAAARLGWIR